MLRLAGHQSIPGFNEGPCLKNEIEVNRARHFLWPMGTCTGTHLCTCTINTRSYTYTKFFLKKIKLKVYTKWPGVGGEEVRVGILL